MRPISTAFDLLKRHRLIPVLLVLGALCLTAAAQAPAAIRPEDYQRNIKPKVPEHRADPASLPERKIDLADDKTVLLEQLKGVKFVRAAADVVKTGVSKPGIDVTDIKMLDTEGFRKIIEPYLGKKVTMRTISMMVRDTILYYQANDRPVVDVFVPEQEITGGTVQLMVVEARVGEIKTEGFKWFGEHQIRKIVRLKSGDVIYASELLADVDYFNLNPFRFARPVLQPGKDFGTTDLVLEGKDRFPIRFYAGYEDTGSRDTQLGRFFAGINMGNLWDKGHEAGYQYTTNTRISNFGIHSAYYRVPLSNRDSIAVFGNLANYKASTNGGKLDSNNWMVHGRYITRLPSGPNLRHSLEFGLDFRHAENDLASGTIYDDYIDVTQLALQYGGRMRDRYGDSSFVVNGYWAPYVEILSSHQNRAHYNAARPGSRPEYIYAHASLERLWKLPKKWDLMNRVTGQVSNHRLPPTEQLGLGGYNTVRGFDERDMNADQGLMGTIELRTPPIDLGFKENNELNLPSYLQFIAFCDYGYGRNRGSAVGEMKSADLLSVGGGLRIRIRDNVHVRLDYGQKLSDVPGSDSSDGRFHIFVLISR